MKKDFLHVNDLSESEFYNIIDVAHWIKKKFKDNADYSPLSKKTMAMIFAKPSARTRISFETGFFRLGGHALFLGPNDIGIGKRESVTHIAKNLDRWVDGVVARVFNHSTLINFTQNINVPIINALSDLEHPCQALADMYTIYKQFNKFDDVNFTYIGDGNNIAASLSLIAAHLGVNFTYSSPAKYQIPSKIFQEAKTIAHSKETKMDWYENPTKAVNEADIIYTDKWVSMGMESEQKMRIIDFKDYQVTKELISSANNNVLIMHDMPAKEGEEIEEGIIDSEISLAFEQAENRLHSQTALLYKLYS